MLVIGWIKFFLLWHNWSEATHRTGWWHLTSKKLVHIPQNNFTWKPVVLSRNVGCFSQATQHVFLSLNIIVSVSQNNYLPKLKDLLTTEKSGYFATPRHWQSNVDSEQAKCETGLSFGQAGIQAFFKHCLCTCTLLIGTGLPDLTEDTRWVCSHSSTRRKRGQNTFNDTI